MQQTYTAIIGVYQGIQHVPAIIASLRLQTVQPVSIIIWVNAEAGKNVAIQGTAPDVTVIVAHRNLGCFARFSAVGLCDTQYVMLLDDDTIPGNEWAANCFKTIELKGDAIIGTRGVILEQESYWPFKTAGAETRNSDIVECDLVGHNWFFKTKNIIHFLRNQPVTRKTGEDIQLSACAKMAGIRTYCPPHPENNIALWGSTKPYLGLAPGRISTSQSTEQHFQERGDVVRYWIQKGWKPLFMEKNV